MKRTLMLISIIGLISGCSSINNDDTKESTDITVGILEQTYFVFKQYEFVQPINRDNEIIGYKFKNYLKETKVAMTPRDIVSVDDYINFNFESIDYVVPSSVDKNNYKFTGLCEPINIGNQVEEGLKLEYYYRNSTVREIEVSGISDRYFYYAVID